MVRANEPDVSENAGRCDICGSLIDMSADDIFVTMEFGTDADELSDEHDLTRQDVVDGVADAMHSVAETPAGRDLAETIRTQQEIGVHGDCLDDTNFSQLQTEPPGHGGDGGD